MTTAEHRQYLNELANLPPTTELERRLQAVLGQLEQSPTHNRSGWKEIGDLAPAETPNLAAAMVQLAQWKLERGHERDAIAATRPAGCWCLGAGYRGELAFQHLWHREDDPPKFLLPDNPWPVPFDAGFCPCPDGQAARERILCELAEQRVAKAVDRWRRYWYSGGAGVPGEFKDWRLESSPLRAKLPQVFGPMESLADPKRWWFLRGAKGRGKTGIAVGYAWHYMMALQQTVLFRSTSKIISEVQATFNPPQHRDENGNPIPYTGPTKDSLMRHYATVGLLVLDDLGAEYVRDTGENSWLASLLNDVIGERHANGLPTVITSNYAISELEDRITDRLTWRIIERCGGRAGIIHVEGENLRDVGRRAAQ